ncbi:hypothetical protein FRC11_003221, partial [Ceratobasidium sp. 423]
MATSASPRKRRRPSGHFRDSPRLFGGPTSRPTWAENVKLLADDITDSFNTFFAAPMDAQPTEILHNITALQTMCLDIIKVLDSISRNCVRTHPTLVTHLAMSEQHTQTEDPTPLVDTGVQSDLPPATPPAPPTKPAQPATSQENSWSQAASWHKPHRT